MLASTYFPNKCIMYHQLSSHSPRISARWRVMRDVISTVRVVRVCVSAAQRIDTKLSHLMCGATHGKRCTPQCSRLCTLSLPIAKRTQTDFCAPPLNSWNSICSRRARCFCLRNAALYVRRAGASMCNISICATCATVS